MPAATMTAIGKWGNSEAVRIPKAIITKAGLRSGDAVSFSVLGPGQIAITREDVHRRVAPAEDVSFEELFAKYRGDAGKALSDQKAAAAAWIDDDLIGAEWDAWER